MSALTSIEASYAADFTALVAAGTDKPLPIYNVSNGTARMHPVSEFLGDPHKAARELLFRACSAAERGETVMAASLLKAFTVEVAAEYGVTTAEAVELISDEREAA